MKTIRFDIQIRHMCIYQNIKRSHTIEVRSNKLYSKFITIWRRMHSCTQPPVASSSKRSKFHRGDPRKCGPMSKVSNIFFDFFSSAFAWYIPEHQTCTRRCPLSTGSRSFCRRCPRAPWDSHPPSKARCWYHKPTVMKEIF